jgi:hypothetical protein
MRDLAAACSLEDNAAKSEVDKGQRRSHEVASRYLEASRAVIIP